MSDTIKRVATAIMMTDRETETSYFAMAEAAIDAAKLQLAWAAAWQPIETAPRDGTEVLLWDRRRCVVARWDEAEIWVPGYGAEDWPSPTHWMPTPAPPNA